MPLMQVTQKPLSYQSLKQMTFPLPLPTVSNILLLTPPAASF
jgi:hypothetical protein